METSCLQGLVSASLQAQGPVLGDIATGSPSPFCFLLGDFPVQPVMAAEGDLIEKKCPEDASEAEEPADDEGSEGMLQCAPSTTPPTHAPFGNLEPPEAMDFSTTAECSGSAADFIRKREIFEVSHQESLALACARQSNGMEGSGRIEPSWAGLEPASDAGKRQAVYSDCLPSINGANLRPGTNAEPVIENVGLNETLSWEAHHDQASAEKAVVKLTDMGAMVVSVLEGTVHTATPQHSDGPPRIHNLTGMRHISRQGSTGAADGQDGVVEVALSIEELGKVRLVITPGDKPAVAIFADLPETRELLRRNEELLHKELHSAGIDGADIAFSDGNDHRRDRSALPESRKLIPAGQEQSVDFIDQASATQPRLVMDLRIDMRI
jgi:hypothetical protein